MHERQKAPKRTYQHKAPKFRPTPSPREQRQWEDSVYYWWWRYLRLNEDYRRCCERNGRGSMGKLYRAFGNVFDTDFRTWWMEGKRGETLFAEPAAQITMRELRSVSEWDKNWRRNQAMVVVVPLNEPVWRLARSFSGLLKERHTGKPGVAHITRSGATYSTEDKFSCPALEKMCKVYELHQANKESGGNLKLAQIGKKAGVHIDYGAKAKADDVVDDESMRQVMASTVSRYLKKARVLIANVGLGKFPKFDE